MQLVVILFVFLSMQRGQNTDSGSICREASFEGISGYVYLASICMNIIVLYFTVGGGGGGTKDTEDSYAHWLLQINLFLNTLYLIRHRVLPLFVSYQFM